jgi:hypothetical protein
VPYAEIGTIEDGQGNHTQVRWDEKTGVVQVRLYRFPMNKPPNWVWVSVGIANSTGAAIMTAQNWARG